MVSRLFSGFKYTLLFGGLCLTLTFLGCKSAETAADSNTASSQGADTTQPAENTGGVDSSKPGVNTTESNTVKTGITITYRNQSSDVQVVLDPSKERFFLDLGGVTPAEKDTLVIADSTLIKNRANDIQKLLKSYREAQDLFYLEEYEEALTKVNETLRIQETADAYALKGTIYFMMDNLSATRLNWNRAVRLNPDLPIPSIPELEEIIREIKGGND